MKKFIMIIITFCFFTSCSTQRVIIPQISETPRTSIKLNRPVLFSILDARTTKEKSSEVIASIKNGLKNTYGKSLNWFDYFSPIPVKYVAVKIRLKANEANFGSRIISVTNMENTFSSLIATVSNNWNQVIVKASHQQTTLGNSFYAEGWWIGSSWIELEIFDNSKGKLEKITFPIIAENKESNTWGYRSANKAASKSWNIVSQQLIQVMDTILINLRSQGY